MNRNDRRFRLFTAFVIAALLGVALINLYQARTLRPAAVPYSRLLDQVAAGQVRSVTLSGQRIAGQYTDNRVFSSYAADDPEFVRQLRQHGVTISAEAPPADVGYATIIAGVLAFALLLALGWPWLRQRVRDGGGAGASKARQPNAAQTRVSFADVAGADEARESLQEIVDFLREPQRFQRLGGRIPRGVLLVGPPGTGKTLLARAIAGEAGVPFFSISGSDFVEMFVGVGASRVRALFEQAKKSAPCIIFMDEIDAVGRRRGSGGGASSGGSDEREQTLNQLLVEMDGFETQQSVILIAATNRPDVLDPALLRPGRFDRQIVIDNPDRAGREQILQVHVRKVPLDARVDLATVARGTAGFSGADLMNLVNEAALLAARRGANAVGMREFDDARDIVSMGAERRTQVIGAEEKRLIAYREGGRAIVALRMPAADPVHKVTIVTRGRAAGMVKQWAEQETAAFTLPQLRAQLAILMAGRAAEELVFGRDGLTSAPANDIELATRLARSMVTRYGLSEVLGAVAYEDATAETFLGAAAVQPQALPEGIARLIAAEVRRYVEAGLDDARRILTEQRSSLDTLAQALLQQETLTADEVLKLLSPPAA